MTYYIFDNQIHHQYMITNNYRFYKLIEVETTYH